MEAKTSKAQIEVWEWKEALYNELKNIPRNKRLAYLRQKAKPAADRIKKKQSASEPINKVAETQPKYGRKK